jgi:lytic cellulose monooxygenase (C1-hydroxylating)
MLRAEIIALHEAFFSGGAQFYMECVQIEVTSPGTKTLPAGVAIPGAYRADDPGVFFNLYNGFASYTIPGPPVWDGASGPAAPSQQAPSQNPAGSPSAVATTVQQQPALSNVPPTTLQTQTTARPGTSPSAVPSTPSNPPPASGGAYIWQQCGGINWNGPKACYEGLICTEKDPYYSQCLSGPAPRPASIWEQCGGEGWKGATTCHPGLVCKGDRWYAQCVPA